MSEAIDLTRYPEIYLDLVDKGSEAITEKLGLPADQARLAAYCVTEVIRKDWAGQQPYFSKGLAYDITKRDREMFGKFTGSNHGELAKEYGMTTRQIYDRIALIRDEEFKRRQPALFE